MYLMVNIIGLWYILAKALTSIIVLIWNFLANKFWTFNLSKKTVNRSDVLSYELSIIIPAYNEARRLGRTLNEIEKFIEKENLNAEIIVVNDGSQDNTKEIAEQFQIKNNNLKTNQS